jgi:hypothetical protein
VWFKGFEWHPWMRPRMWLRRLARFLEGLLDVWVEGAVVGECDTEVADRFLFRDW